MHKTPIRMCAVCRKHAEQDSMIRVVRTQDKIYVSDSRKLCGRSIYICKNEECISKAIKQNLVARTLGNHDESIYEEIKKVYADSQS